MGLTQFTPATADWISQRFPYELGENQPLNPDWALRALARYDRYLWERAVPAATNCHRWAFTLSAYNGGEGWTRRDRKVADDAGADPSWWWGHVSAYSRRSAAAFRENRQYPDRILLDMQRLYVTWGPGVSCEEVYQ